MNQQQRVKAHELRGQEEDALKANLNKFRQELVSLRTSKVSSAPQVKLARIRVTRKAIARTLTVINEQRREATRQAQKKVNNKREARDLRWKNSTKHSRRQLTRHDQQAVTLRQAKRA